MPSFPELTDCSLVFRPLFSKRVWHSVQILIKGAILAVGSRTVTAILRVMGLSEDRQFQRFHRVLNRNTWSTLQASRRLLMALLDAFAPLVPPVMALADTIERPPGAKGVAEQFLADKGRAQRTVGAHQVAHRPLPLPHMHIHAVPAGVMAASFTRAAAGPGPGGVRTHQPRVPSRRTDIQASISGRVSSVGRRPSAAPERR